MHQYLHYLQSASNLTTSERIQLVSVVVTFLAIVVALSIARYQDTWKDRQRRSKSSVLGTVTHLQHQESLNAKHKLHYLRLILHNSGYTAGRVEVSVIQILDQSIKRENFLEVPLNWTHGQVYDPSGVIRDIQKNQTAYLDVYSGPIDYSNLHLCTGVSGNADFRDLNPGKTSLTLALFQKSGQTKNIIVELNWIKGQQPTLIKVS